jgi:hypothetical protein
MLNAYIYCTVSPLADMCTSCPSEVLLLLEEHPEADDRAVNEQTSNNAHYHGWNSDDMGMC